MILHDFLNDLILSAWKYFLESFLPLKPNQMTLFQILLLFVLISLRSLSPSTSSPSLAARPQPRPILDPEAETNALEAELNRGGSREERSRGGGRVERRRTVRRLAGWEETSPGGRGPADQIWRIRRGASGQPGRGELCASERAGKM